VVNKPAGMQVHPARHSKLSTSNNPTPFLTDWFVKHYPNARQVGDGPEAALERPGVVHRLDKETSGVIVLARTQGAFNFLKREFMSHNVNKTYLAIVRGVPRQKRGIIDIPIGITNGTLKRSIGSSRMKKEAVTEYELEKSFGQYSKLMVRPKTGRTHQIRVHLSAIGHPIAGDRLYGGRNQPAWATRTMLHALRLELALPGKNNQVFFEAPIPGDMRAALDELAAV